MLLIPNMMHYSYCSFFVTYKSFVRHFYRYFPAVCGLNNVIPPSVSMRVSR